MNAGQLEQDLHWLGGLHLAHEFLLLFFPVFFLLILLFNLVNCEGLCKLLFTLVGVLGLSALASAHLKQKLRLSLLVSLGRDTIAIASYHLDVSEANKEGSQVVDHLRVEHETRLLKPVGHLLDVDAPFERVLLVFVLENAQEKLLRARELGPDGRSLLSVHVEEASKGLLEGLEVEVSWLLVLSVLLGLDFSLELLQFGSSTGLLDSLALLAFLATNALARLFLVFPVQVVALSVDVALRQAEDLQGVQ